MANKALKGLTIEIGADTTELTKALDKTDKQSRNLSSELGQINKLLKLDPSNTELLAQKQKVLADAISNTEDRLGLLKEAEKQAQEQFARGEISEEQYRALQREIIETENKLDRYKNAAKETADAVEALGKEADDTAEEIENQAEKTEEAEEATDDLDDSANDLASGGLAAVAAAAAAAVTAIVALAEESREYRVAMGKLNTAFVDSGHSAEVATKTYEELQSILGETDQAVEAASFLAKLCTTEEELAAWTEIAAGVYGTFGAALPIEGLTEAANETMRAGQVTGPFADALNWAAKEGETFGVTLKKNTKANEEWNKAVEEAATAEDYFNLALQECSNEQERQQLITKTLTKLYGSAAEQYKETNAEVIRANKATEKWNKATAKIGKAVEPVVTDIKELGVTLLEDAGEPLENIADFIRTDVIPAIKSVSTWVKQNGPLIKGTITGVTAALVAYKVATIATEVAQKGLKGAIMATTVAQEALNLAQKASPIGLIVTAAVALTAAMFALALSMDEANKPADMLTKKERELMAAADEAAEAFREQQKATNDALADATAQMGYVSQLAAELQGLADASGKVKESDQERASFILNELNEALGTEYKMVDGVIKNYKDLKKSIDEVIQSKLANTLVEAANADYVTAIQNEAAALENLNLKELDYQNQLVRTEEAKAAYVEANNALNDAMLTGDQYAIEFASLRLADAKTNWAEEEGILADKKSEYEKAATDYGNYYNTIANYEEAQAAALSGNYDKTVDILKKKGGSYGTYSDKVDTETAKVLDTLYKEAIDAGLEAERTRKNFEKGVDGYTTEMVQEADQGYKEALRKFQTAYADAESVGEDVGDGFTAGMENKRSNLLKKAKSLVTGVISAMRKEADSHSPSRKMIAFGEDMGEGAEIGLDEKTDDIRKTAEHQVQAMLDVYSGKDTSAAAQRSLNAVESRYQAQAAQAAASNAAQLEKILAAIERGQILTIDSNALVGATAGKTDNTLGQRRALAARGAR